jgi:gliotoxin biosynthesis N-methyltransferase
MSEQDLVDNYPSERDLTETEHLHAQHDLVVDALGGLVLCPADLTKPNLHILDLGTADGWWLEQVRRELKHPGSATLVGTDIAPYPSIKENVIIHNFKTPFPSEWKGTFDLVQLRAVLSNVPGEASIFLIKRAVDLIKPGGYIQLVDGAIPKVPKEDISKPSQRYYNTLAAFLESNKLDPNQGAHVEEVLREAGGDKLCDIGAKVGAIKIGKGAPLESTSCAWVRGQTDVTGKAFVGAGMMSTDEFQQLKLSLFEEARQDGFSLTWYAAWAKTK